MSRCTSVVEWQRRSQMIASKRSEDENESASASSTFMFGSLIFAWTVARAGVWPGMTQASQTLFMAAKSEISLSQIVAVRIFDLSLPPLASRESISASACCTWPVMSVVRWAIGPGSSMALLKPNVAAHGCSPFFIVLTRWNSRSVDAVA